MNLWPEYNAKNMDGPIIALGELLVDLLPGNNNKISEPGEVIKTASGSSGIFACAVARLGAKSGFLGKIGIDSLTTETYYAAGTVAFYSGMVTPWAEMLRTGFLS